MHYLHTKLQIAHRDLKPENLLLLDPSKLKIIDFGLSNEVNDKHPYLRTTCGSPCYAAPEMILCTQNSAKRYDAFKSDIWSCGVILYTMLCGALPFLDKNVNRLYEKILHTEPLIPQAVPSEAAQLVWMLLNKNPKHRPSIEEIRSHPFFQKNMITLLANDMHHKIVMKECVKFGINNELLKNEIKTNR